MWRNNIRKVLQASEAFKGRFRLADKTAADFQLTAGILHGGIKSDFSRAWASESGCGRRGGDEGDISPGCWGPYGPCGKGSLQKVLDALVTLGIMEEESNSLLRGLSAILHLGQARKRPSAARTVLSLGVLLTSSFRSASFVFYHLHIRVDTLHVHRGMYFGIMAGFHVDNCALRKAKTMLISTTTPCSAL